eukprot:1959174-Rhodomonas_salina.3
MCFLKPPPSLVRQGSAGRKRGPGSLGIPSNTVTAMGWVGGKRVVGGRLRLSREGAAFVLHPNSCTLLVHTSSG